MNQVKDNLIGEVKSAHVKQSKAKQEFTQYFPSASKCPATTWEAEPWQS